MTYLVIKFLALFALAVACGAVLATWWFRRRYEDVSSTFATLSQTSQLVAERPWDAVLGRVAASESTVRDVVERGLSTLRAHLAPPDLAPLDRRLVAIEQAMQGLQSRDLPRLSTALSAQRRVLEDALADMHAHVQERLTALSTQLAQVAEQLTPLQQTRREMSGLGGHLTTLESAVGTKLEQNQRMVSVAVHGLSSQVADAKEWLMEVATTYAQEREERVQSRAGAARLEALLADLQQQAMAQLPNKAEVFNLSTALGAVSARLEANQGSTHSIHGKLATLVGHLDALSAEVHALSSAGSADNLAALRAHLATFDAQLEGLVKEETAIALCERAAALQTALQQTAAAERPADTSSQLEGLAVGIDDLKRSYLEPIVARFDFLNDLVSSTPPPPPTPDLGPLHERVIAIEQALATLHKSFVVEALSPVAARLRRMEEAIGTAPDALSRAQPDWQPLQDRLASMEHALRDVAQGVVALSTIQDQLGTIESRLTRSPQRLSSATGANPSPLEHRPSLDFALLHERLSDMERALKNLPPPAVLNLAPLREQLDRIEAALEALTPGETK